MLLSNACEYGIRAMLYLASLKTDEYVSIRKISKELEISFPFLAKIFQSLSRAGLVASSRGKSGGVALARPAGSFSLKEVVLAVDGPRLFTHCVLGLPGCGEQKPCPIHAQWAGERARIDRMFSGMTLLDASDPINTLEVRLKAGT